MLKLAGSLMVVGGLGWIGWSLALELRRKTVLLRALIGSLERMEREVAVRLTPLPTLCLLLSQEAPSPLDRFFALCGEKREEPFEAGWEAAAKLLRQSLDGPVLDCLLRLGRSLGRSDSEGERALLASAVEELKGLLARSEENALRQGRLYGALGLTAGLFCVILLI